MLQEYQTLPSNIKTSPIQSFTLQEHQTLPNITKASPIPTLMLQGKQTLPKKYKNIFLKYKIDFDDIKCWKVIDGIVRFV